MSFFSSKPIGLLMVVLFLSGSLSCSGTVPIGPTQSDSPSKGALKSDSRKPDNPNEIPEAIEPGQVCVINANQQEAKKLDQYASAQGYTKKKRRELEGLGFVMSILQVPEGQTVKQGVDELRREFPSQVIDANHHYNLQETGKRMNPRRYGHQLVGWNEQAMSCGVEKLRLGMVDTSVNVTHPLLTAQSLHTKSFLNEKTPRAPGQHGTAIAILLVANSPQAENGLLPQAELFAAETFRQLKPGHVEATTWSIVRALDWLVTENVHVINLSLGGPQNALLTFAIQQTINSNVPIVAAAGNTGSSGQPMYPAAEAGVIAVTALDAKLIPYHHASRGSYIAFSAPGVDIWIPDGNETGMFKSGTSFAAPFVTSAAAAVKLAHPDGTPNQVMHQLANSALDLGSPGKDDVFGWGLIQIPDTCPTRTEQLLAPPSLIHS